MMSCSCSWLSWKRLAVWVAVCGLILLLESPAVLAHKVNIFAWIEGDCVCTESYFADGKEVEQGAVEVFDGQGNRLTAGQTNEEGRFDFELPCADEVVIVLNASMGHKASYRMELTGEMASETETVEVNQEVVNFPGSSQQQIDGAELSQRIEDMLDRKLAPIARQLARNQEDGVSLQDIAGGIGYIVGLAGLILWASAKHSKE